MSKDLDMTKENDHMIFWRKLSKKTKTKAVRGGRSIRMETLPQSMVDDLPGEQEATSATYCEGWSHAADVLRTPDTSSDAIVLRDDPP